MRHSLFTLTIVIMTLNNSQAQRLDFAKMKSYEHQLDDVMELIDANIVKSKLKEVEMDFQTNPNEINKVRLGIIYHETALNLSFLDKPRYKGFAKRSYDILTESYSDSITTAELFPFITSYRASALSLVSAETKNLKFLGEAFTLFKDAVAKYSSISYLPEFLRGSVAENLPWIFLSKRKYAKEDFQSILSKRDNNTEYANWKIMSFTYWAWAKQHQSKKYRKQALEYLDHAIVLDPNYKAGRQKAEELKNIMSK